MLEKPQSEKSQPTNEKLNNLGLPETWSRDRSIQALEYIQKNLEGQDLTKEKIRSLLEKVFSITVQEYKKYRGQNVSPVETDHVNTDNISECEHLKMTPDQKLIYFKKRYPLGLKIMGTDKFIKWEIILDYELWAIGNHQQTFATLNRRGGLTPRELSGIIFGIKSVGEIGNPTNESLLNWFKENELLVE